MLERYGLLTSTTADKVQASFSVSVAPDTSTYSPSSVDGSPRCSSVPTSLPDNRGYVAVRLKSFFLGFAFEVTVTLPVSVPPDTSTTRPVQSMKVLGTAPFPLILPDGGG